MTAQPTRTEEDTMKTTTTNERHPDTNVSHARRRRRPLLAWALAAALAGTLAAAAPASACGMEIFWQPPPSPEKLLARAAVQLRQGHAGSAGLRARQVIDLRSAKPAQKAAAYTILAWTQLHRGDHDAALISLAHAQALSAGAVSTILALAPIDPTMQALRAAKKV
jgi:hypothetical protein